MSLTGKIATSGMAAALLALPFVLGCSSTLPEEVVTHVEDVTRNYYQAPDPARAMAVLGDAKKCVAKRGETSIMPFTGFYYGAAKTSPDQKPAWLAARAKVGCAVLAMAIDDGLEGKKLDELITDPVEEWSPGTLDFFWGYFLATGDPEAPRRVIKRGGMKVPEDAVVDPTGASAVWSTLSLAKEHPIVKAELEKFTLASTESEVLNFFGGRIPDRARELLSTNAIAHVEGIYAKIKEREK